MKNNDKYLKYKKKKAKVLIIINNKIEEIMITLVIINLNHYLQPNFISSPLPKCQLFFLKMPMYKSLFRATFRLAIGLHIFYHQAK